MLMGTTGILMSLSQNASAGLECDLQKLNQCHATTSANTESYNRDVVVISNLLQDSGSRKARCWNDQREAEGNKARLVRELDGKTGALEALAAPLDFSKDFLNQLNSQYEVISRFQVRLQSHFRDVLIALKSDVTANSTGELETLQGNLKTELAVSPDTSTSQVLRVVISMVEELRQTLQNDDSGEKEFMDRLKMAVAKEAIAGGSASRLSILSKAAIQGVISDRDVEEMDLNSLMSALVLLSGHDLNTYKNQVERETQKYAEVKAKVANLKWSLYLETNRTASLQSDCTKLQYQLDQKLPADLASAQQAVKNSSEYYWNGCQNSCCWHTPSEAPHGGGRD